MFGELPALLDLLDRRRLLPCVGPEVRRAARLPSLHAAIAAHDPALVATLTPSQAFGRLVEVEGLVRVRHRFRPLLDDRDAPAPKVVGVLSRLSPAFDYVLTTNPDRILDRAFGGYWPAMSPMAIEQHHGRVIVQACGGLDDDELALTYESLFGKSGIARRDGLARLLRAHTLLFVGYPPGDEALRFLVDACGGAVEGFALVPDTGARLPSFYPASVTAIPVRAPFDANAAALLHALAEAYKARKNIELPSSGEKLPLTRGSDPPFPGLEPYTASNHRFFCGREDEVRALVARLRDLGAPCWCHIEGVSGVGKSSFVRAGLRPCFETGDPFGDGRRWVVAEVRPSYDPLGALAGALCSSLAGLADTVPGALVRDIQRDPRKLCDLLDVHLAADEGLFLAIDPLDEALTLASADQAVFAHALAFAVARAQRPLVLVTTLRSDYAEMMARLPALYERLRRPEREFRRIHHVLPPLSREQLALALTRAARRGGVEFEPGLVDRLLRDADPERWSIESIHVLPNIAVALGRLWEQRTGERLIHDAYRGIENAVTEAADEVVGPLIPRFGEPALRALFLSLVIVDEGSRRLRRQLARADVVARLSAAPALINPDRIDELLAAVSGGDAQLKRQRTRLVSAAADHLELVHDALLQGWPRLSRWIDTYHEDLLQTESLCQAARRWQFFGEPPDVAAHGAELLYLLQATPVDRLSRRYQQTLRDSHDALKQRSHALSTTLTELRDSVIPCFPSDPPPIRPLVDAVRTGVERAIDLHRPPRAPGPPSARNLFDELWQADELLRRKGALAALAAYRNAHRRAAQSFRQAPVDREIKHGLACALLRLGDVELQEGRVADACHYLQRARRLYEDLCDGEGGESYVAEYIDALSRLAGAELSRGQFEGARELLRRAQAIAEPVRGPRLARVLTQLAHITLTHVKDPDEAGQQLLEATSCAPETGFVLDALANFELRPGGDLAKAREHLEGCVELARRAVRRKASPEGKVEREAVEKVGISRCRELALRLCRLGELKVKQLELDGAEADIAEALVLAEEVHRLDPSVRSKRDLSRCLDRAGVAAEARGDEAAAQRCFDAARELDRDCVAFDPNNVRLRYSLAVALARCGDDDGALEHCDLLQGYPPAEQLRQKIEKRRQSDPEKDP